MNGKIFFMSSEITISFAQLYTIPIERQDLLIFFLTISRNRHIDWLWLVPVATQLIENIQKMMIYHILKRLAFTTEKESKTGKLRVCTSIHPSILVEKAA